MDPMRRSVRGAGPLLLALVAAACGGGAAYRVTELGPLPAARPFDSLAFGINGRNQVVGRVEEAGGVWRAVLWEPDGAVVDLGTLGGGARNSAYSINDDGEVVGSASGPSGIRAFRWSRGRMREIAVPDATLSEAMSIGPDGDVAGWYYRRGDRPGQGRTFLASDGTVRDLGPHNVGAGTGFAVGKHAQVVGVRLADAAAASSHNRAFMWYDGVARDLGTLPRGRYSWATDIVVSAWPPDPEETRFTIVGASDVGEESAVPILHGFLYTRGRMRDLRTLPEFPIVVPAALNNRGTVVGTMESADRRVTRAFIYTGVILDLNLLIPDDAGWVLEGASDVNDRGFIVGWGRVHGQRRAFLLSPR